MSDATLTPADDEAMLPDDETADSVLLGAEASEPEDNTELTLWSWGLSGEPVGWATTAFQPVIYSIRQANIGFGTLETVQDLLDSTFPDVGYLAANVALAHTPVGLMTDIEIEDLSIHGHLDEADEDLGLPDGNVRWYFGDGATTTAAAGSTTPMPRRAPTR